MKTADNRGLAAMILAYAIWGLFPIYWRGLHSMDSAEILFMRLILTAGVCLLLLPLRGSFPAFREALASRRTLRIHLLAALLLSGNWFSFIWAVTHDRVLDSSLGYFLCPLASVLLGRFVEKERLGPYRRVAVFLAAAGVTVLLLEARHIPWAAFAIAGTWSCYGLMKKRNPLGPVVSLGLETSLLSLPAALILVYLHFQAGLSIGQAEPLARVLLPFSGALTALPLLLFAFGAQRLRLSTMGMGQYAVPSLHFFLALAWGEPMPLRTLAAFLLIWTALVLYSLAARQDRRNPV